MGSIAVRIKMFKFFPLIMATVELVNRGVNDWLLKIEYPVFLLKNGRH